MKPYFEDELTTLYHGDCCEVLPNLAPCDVVITDPPWPNCPSEYLELWGCGDPQKLFAKMIAALPGPPKRLVVVMRSDSDPRFLSAIPAALPFFRCQILPYVMPGYIGRKLGGDEIAYCFGEPIPSAEGQRVIPGYAPKAQPFLRMENGHPMSRCLDHFIWLCRWWSLPGETILDPFCGSATTLVAARRHGNRAIGIEQSEEFCQLAVRRLLEDAAQPKFESFHAVL